MSARPAYDAVSSFLANGDVEGLIAFHRDYFGDAKMSTPPAPPTTEPYTPVNAPPASQQGVWGPGITPPTLPGPFPGGAPQQGQVWDAAAVQAAVEAARREERDKLHGRLSQVDDLAGRLTAAEEREQARLKEIADAKAAQEAAEAEAAELARKAELTTQQRLEELERDFQSRLAQEQAERRAEQAIFAQEQRFRDLADYRARAIADNQDRVAPQFFDYITGQTTEEIDASIAQAIAKTDSIVAETQQAQQQSRLFQAPMTRTVAPTGFPPDGGPLDTTSQQTTYSDADIAAMGPAEYAKHRGVLLPAVSRLVQEQGLYGQR
jgi:hypothetical protein